MFCTQSRGCQQLQFIQTNFRLIIIVFAHYLIKLIYFIYFSIKLWLGKMEDKKPIGESKNADNLHPKTVGRAAVLLIVAVLLFSALLVRIFHVYALSPPVVLQSRYS